MKTLVLGLGNPILSDDGVGVHIVRQAAARWRRAGAVDGAQACVAEDAGHSLGTGDSDAVVFREASIGGLRLLDFLQGCHRAVIVDAIQTRGGSPGKIYFLHPRDLRTSLHSSSTHDLSLSGALALGRRLGLELPDDDAILLVAVEVEDVLTFGEGCTPAVAAAIPSAAEQVLWAASADRHPRICPPGPVCRTRGVVSWDQNRDQGRQR